MTLKDYLDLEGNSATKLAAATGVSVSTITRAASGQTLPTKELMAAIVRETQGAVTPNDFFEYVPPQASAEAEAA